MARAAGAEVLIDYRREDWVDRVKRETGALRPVIFETFPLARAADALATIGSRESYGKVVLVP